MKIRVTGESEEVELALKVLRQNFIIISESLDYKNRNSVEVRKYLEVKLKNI